MNKKIYFITGASGVGKTTLLEQLKNKYADNNWSFLHFDSIGVPSPEEMERDYGSGAGWQEAMTHEWIKKMLTEYDQEKIFLEGQVNLEFIQKGFAQHDFSNYQIILIHCDPDEMMRRLTEERAQPELATDDMRNWLAYLKRQAEEMQVPIIDTTDLDKGQVLEELANRLEL